MPYKDKYKAQERREERRYKKKQYIEGLKTKCRICGEEDKELLLFHHRKGAIRNASVASMVDYSIEKINEERAKCIVLCRSCHRIFHIYVLPTN